MFSAFQHKAFVAIALGKDDQKHLKAIVIQCAFRCYWARQTVRDKYACVYTKEQRDENSSSSDTDVYVYKNKRTQSQTSSYPSFLGDYFDLPSPRQHHEQAPYDYTPGIEDTTDGYLLFVTTNTFSIEGWAGMPTDMTDNDHRSLTSLLTHEFIGKFRDTNTFILKDPTTKEFKDMLSKLRRLCKASGFLIIYIATHIVQVLKGEKETNPTETCYFACSNSVWGSAEEIAESCISLSFFCEQLNLVCCRRKTLLLNYAFVNRPKPTFFPASRTLYPPKDFLSRLSALSRCVVIGCCAVGSHVGDYYKFAYAEQLRFEESERKRVVAAAGSAGPRPPTDSTSSGTESYSSSLVRYESFLDSMLRDWNLPSVPVVRRSEKPVPPSAVWERDGSKSIHLQLPSDDEKQNYSRRLTYWKLKRTLAGPPNYIRELLRARRVRSYHAPCQVSMGDVEKRHTLFAKAIASALRGGLLCKPSEETVTAIELYRHIHKYVTEGIEQLNRIATTNKDAEMGDTASVAAIRPEGAVLIVQTPLMFVPEGSLQQQRDSTSSNPVFFRCGPPPAPERPYIIYAGDREVMLEWYNPPVFDGIPAHKYKIASKSVSRIFSYWTDIAYPGDITKTRFLVRNLTMGLACQFKVAAFNNGGWSQYSLPTVFVTPGERRDVIPHDIRWRRIKQGGAFAVIDKLGECSCDRDEFLLGLQFLLRLAQAEQGFRRTKVTFQVASLALKSFDTFPLDPDICPYAFKLLAWCMTPVKFERKIKQLCMQSNIVETVGKYLAYFRGNSQVVASISFLRRGDIGRYLPDYPAMELKPLIPPDDEEEGEEEDSEEGEEEDGDSMKSSSVVEVTENER